MIRIAVTTVAVTVPAAVGALGGATTAWADPPAPAMPGIDSSVGVARIRAARTEAPILIDGKQDEPAWATAPTEGHFTQQLPYGGHPPSEPTTLRVLYDAQAIYIGINCEQKLSPILQHLTRRDEDSESDWVWVYLDSRRDGKSANFFALNVAGVQYDGTLHDGSTFSIEWDENWEGHAAITPTGWSVELRIPLRALRYAADLPVQDWGIWVSRFVAATQERDDWPYIPRELAAPIPLFARLDDLRSLPRPSQIELRPFGVVRLRHVDANQEVLVHGWDSGLAGLAAGLDVKLHLTQSITFDGAITPDFAQVEADQLVFNATNYETQFPEKRALFLEGADQYLTPLPLFYSRRIGSSPLTPTLKSGSSLTEPSDGILVDFPVGSTIYAAAKLGGRVGDDWTFGMLTALAARNDYDVQIGTLREHRTIEPLTMFSVLRLRRDLGHDAQLGLLGTGVSRFEDTGADRTCPTGLGVTAGGRCFHDAYVGGIDGLARFGSSNYVVAGQLVTSTVDHGQPDVQADGTPIGSGDSGVGGWARIAKEGGAPMLAELIYTGATRKLDFNDLGFMLRQNLHDLRAGFELRSLDPGRLTLERHARVDLSYRRNLDGLNLGAAAEISGNMRFQGFWYARLALGATSRRFDDREIGDGSALDRPPFWSTTTELATDPRRILAADARVDTRVLPGGSAVTGQLLLSIRPITNVQVDLGPQMGYERGEPRFVWHAQTDDTAPYLFGKLFDRNASLTVRATYTFTPQISLQAFGQLFMVAGHYTDFSSAPRAPGARILQADLAPLVGAPPPDADFQEAALNANVVLRWDYRLGSTLYLVYSRSQIPTVQLEPNEAAALRLSDIGRVPAIDVIMAKLSFWWAS
jgi:hypothetical protein